MMQTGKILTKINQLQVFSLAADLNNIVGVLKHLRRR